MASILNVDKIRATGSTTDGLTIDSSGRVAQPQVIAFCGHKGDITANGGAYSTTGAITFNNTRVAHSAWDGTTFTAPVAGKYRFSITGHKQTTTNASLEFQIKKGSTILVALYSLGASNARPRVAGDCIAELAVNDTVQFHLQSGDFFAGGGNSGSGVTCTGHFLG